MRTPFLILSTLVACQTASAQIVITKNDTMQFGNYVYAVSSNDLDSLFTFDTIGTNCIWDISRLSIDRYDTTIVKSARQGKFGNHFPEAVYVSFNSNDSINEMYSYCDDNGCYINGLAYDGFCGKLQVMEQTKPIKNMEFPFTLFTEFTDSFTWRNPKCGVFDPTNGYYDSSYWEQKENATFKAIASGYIIYSPAFQIPSLLIKVVNRIHVKEYRTTVFDSGEWKTTTDFEFTTTEYIWMTHGKGYDIMRTYNWGLDSRYLKYMPSSILTIIYATGPQYNHFIKTFPNPATNLLNIEISELIALIDITDIRGVNVLSTKGNIQQIDVQHLPPGMYLLKAQSETGMVYTTKFVKE